MGSSLLYVFIIIHKYTLVCTYDFSIIHILNILFMVYVCILLKMDFSKML